MFTSEAGASEKNEPDSLPAKASGYSLNKGGHRELVRKLVAVQQGTSKGLVMALGDTVVYSLHKKGEAANSELGKLKGWSAPDVDAFDRRVPTEFAYVAAYGLLLQIGWARDEIEVGLDFLYEGEGRLDGEKVHVPSGCTRGILGFMLQGSGFRV